MQVNEQGLKNKEQWESKGYSLPGFDRAAVTEKPEKILSGYTSVQATSSVPSRQT